MKLQGQVGGTVHAITQQAPDEPMDGTRACKVCGRKFVPEGSGHRVYCSVECRQAAHREHLRKSWARNSHKYRRKA